jgi:hypothetical protein
MGLIYLFFCSSAFESPGICCCDAPFIVLNPDLAFSGLAIKFIGTIPIAIGILGLWLLIFTGDCPAGRQY